jgi:NTP pyrophosphatase (non-canonical NTP hydrolase)
MSKDYQKKAFETCTDSSKNFHYALLGFIAELGELIETVEFEQTPAILTEFKELANRSGILAKQIRSGQTQINPKTTINLKKFADELGDNAWFLNLCATLSELDIERVEELNLRKLAKRQADNQIINHD